MPRRLLKRFLPEHHKIKNHKHMRIFGRLHMDPNLWHLNKQSVATAVSIGLFMTFMPIPFQMIVAAALAILFRANLPISVVLVWISNPFTIPPILYLAFLTGSKLVSIAPESLSKEFSWHLLSQQLGNIWEPMIIGLFIFAITSAVLGNVLIRFLWRLWIIIKWRSRKNARNNAKQ